MSNAISLNVSPSNERSEHSSMTAINILGRLRIATEQVRAVQTSLSHEGKRPETFVSHGLHRLCPGIVDQVDKLDSVGKELDGMCTSTASDGRRVAIVPFTQEFCTISSKFSRMTLGKVKSISPRMTAKSAHGSSKHFPRDNNAPSRPPAGSSRSRPSFKHRPLSTHCNGSYVSIRESV